MQNTIIYDSRLIQLFVPGSRISKKLQSRSGDNSSHEYHSHTHYSNTVMLKGMQTQKSVFLQNEKPYQSH